MKERDATERGKPDTRKEAIEVKKASAAGLVAWVGFAKGGRTQSKAAQTAAVSLPGQAGMSKWREEQATFIRNFSLPQAWLQENAK